MEVHYIMCGDNFRVDSMVKGDSVDICIDRCVSEIKADITLFEYSTIRVWGQVKNCYGRPICGVLLKLVKVFDCDCKGESYEGIAHTTSDNNGFYQFEICSDDPHRHYKILASKAIFGKECKIS